MDGQFGTPSFIPKKPLATRSGSAISFGGLFLFVSILVFVLSVGGYIGLYVYGKAVEKTIETAKKAVEAKLIEKAVTEKDVNNLFNFNNKIKIAKDLLYLDKNSTQHITLIPLFNLLRESTLKTVRFKDFKYTNIGNDKIELRMSGEAKGYPSIAFQAEAFEAATFDTVTGPEKGLNDVVFTNLNQGQSGLVVFNMTATIEPALMSYSGMILNALQQ